ncbi:chemotaxis protein CheW [Haliovirga abyssi]|uniref:Chemotaxis protein CheW n=1 Tax=Haliovirga abyssi TaxID=2996794 RepID=A0AAU9DP11_9FUSO|nr:chemotaxis protein CheW [Haliovirga abyssi]BDU50128.1 chemotaxis protein CheW [Haliovirga abyssi]
MKDVLEEKENNIDKIILQIIGFTLNGEEYALEIKNVESIIKVIKMTRVPRAEKYIIGVINLRGIVMPIIDLNKKFNLNSKIEKSDSQRIIILKIDTISLGILVDGVSEVIDLKQKELNSNPTISSAISSEYIKGVCKLEEGDRLLTLLSIEKILDLKS